MPESNTDKPVGALPEAVIVGKSHMSEPINEFAAALAKAQGQMTTAKLNCTNPFFKNKYADLASIINTVRKPFSDNGISFIQLPESVKEYIGLTTIMMHSSGQWVKSRFLLKPTKTDPQGAGSALTYLKRYSLSSMSGVAADADDDGNEASKEHAQAKDKYSKKPPPAKKQPTAKPKKTVKEYCEGAMKQYGLSTEQKAVLHKVYSTDYKMLLSYFMMVHKEEMTLDDLFDQAQNTADNIDANGLPDWEEK